MHITAKMIADGPPTTVFVFGDNLQKRGLGGQAAVARPFVPEGRAFGIPTKRAPHMGPAAFFSDRPDEIAAVKDAMATIDKMIESGKHVVFFPNIGEGRAMLKEKSPYIYKMLYHYIRGIHR